MDGKQTLKQREEQRTKELGREIVEREKLKEAENFKTNGSRNERMRKLEVYDKAKERKESKGREGN